MPLSSRSVTSKTCTEACRKKRSRRLKRERDEREGFEAKYPGDGNRAIGEIVRHEAYNAIAKATRAEIQPIVREALTEDVLQAVHAMIGLTPRAVELMAEDLESEDAVVRQRAYTLVAKYTIGHPALLAPKDTEAEGQIVVNFNLPRPEAIEGEVLLDEAPRICDTCNEEKPAGDFESGSARCSACFEEWKRRVVEQFA